MIVTATSQRTIELRIEAKAFAFDLVRIGSTKLESRNLVFVYRCRKIENCSTSLTGRLISIA